MEKIIAKIDQKMIGNIVNFYGEHGYDTYEILQGLDYMVPPREWGFRDHTAYLFALVNGTALRVPWALEEGLSINLDLVCSSVGDFGARLALEEVCISFGLDIEMIAGAKPATARMSLLLIIMIVTSFDTGQTTDLVDGIFNNCFAIGKKKNEKFSLQKKKIKKIIGGKFGELLTKIKNIGEARRVYDLRSHTDTGINNLAQLTVTSELDAILGRLGQLEAIEKQRAINANQKVLDVKPTKNKESSERTSKFIDVMNNQRLDMILARVEQSKLGTVALRNQIKNNIIKLNTQELEELKIEKKKLDKKTKKYDAKVKELSKVAKFNAENKIEKDINEKHEHKTNLKNRYNPKFSDLYAHLDPLKAIENRMPIEDVEGLGNNGQIYPNFIINDRNGDRIDDNGNQPGGPIGGLNNRNREN